MPGLGLGLLLYELAHLVDHFLVLSQELRPKVDFLLQVALRRHEDSILLVVKDADGATK